MKVLLIIIAISLAVNIGGGWLLKKSWQKERELQTKYEILNKKMDQEIATRDAAIEQWRTDYVQLRTEHTEKEQRLIANQHAMSRIETELLASKRRLNELSRESAEFSDCLRVRVPAAYAHELFGSGPQP
jgi:chromosome segregation ATPase